MFNAGSRIVNNWIYPIDKGYVLIDTGYESGFAHFKKQLAKMQIAPQQIRYIFLTHVHDDHAGYLNEVLSECSDLQIGFSEILGNNHCTQTKSNISGTWQAV